MRAISLARKIARLLFVAGTLAVLLARMNAEEALLESEFGDEYASYRRPTWRLVPWVY